VKRTFATLGLMLILVGAPPSIPTAEGQAAEPQAVVVSPLHYDLALRVDYASETIHGTASIVVANQTARPVSAVSFLLYRLLQVDSATTDRGGAGPLEFTQQVTAFSDFGKLQVNHVVVTLPEPLLPEAETVIRLVYGGHLLGYAETGMRYIQDHVDPEFTIIRDDTWAYPKPGYPSLSALRSMPDPSFTYDARITVPRDLVVANGGRLIARDEDGKSVTYRYASLVPSWRMDFAIARFREHAEGPVRIFYMEGDEDGALAVGRAARWALDSLGSWFGPLHGERSLTFIEIPDGWGSQADVTTIIQTAAAFRDSTRHDEVYHEVSHLWNVPANDRPSPRWEEGLAGFLQSLLTQMATGRPGVDTRTNQRIARLRDQLPEHPEWRQVPMLDYGSEFMTDLSYRVGAVMFDLMYRLSGSAAFNQIMGGYYEQFGATGGTTDEFVRLASRISPADLTPLFQDWIYTTGWTERVEASDGVEDLVRHYQNQSSR
jgi:hypothetical protein